jgi:hypothetical protein
MNLDKLRKLKTVIAEYDSTSENEYEHDHYMLNAITEGVRSKNGVFVNATNVNWQGRDGVLMADDMKDAANKMLMNSGNCHTILWKGAERNTIQGVSYHHDCPTGTWFNVMSRAKAIKKGLINKD